MNTFAFLTILVACFTASLASSSCGTAETSVTSFTTGDATIVSQIAFVAEFSVKCSNTDANGLPLFAVFEGKVSPVARVGDYKYQVSWTEEIKKARSGSHLIRLYDEEGFAQIRKVQRTGEDNISSVKPLAEIDLYNSGAYKGPWVNSELVAVGVAAFVAYFAFTAKTKLQS